MNFTRSPLQDQHEEAWDVEGDSGQPDASGVAGNTVLKKLVEVRHDDRPNDGDKAVEAGKNPLKFALSVFGCLRRKHRLERGLRDAPEAEQRQNAEGYSGGAGYGEEKPAEGVKGHADKDSAAPAKAPFGAGGKKSLTECVKQAEDSEGKAYSGGRPSEVRDTVDDPKDAWNLTNHIHRAEDVEQAADAMKICDRAQGRERVELGEGDGRMRGWAVGP